MGEIDARNSVPWILPLVKVLAELGIVEALGNLVEHIAVEEQDGAAN